MAPLFGFIFEAVRAVAGNLLDDWKQDRQSQREIKRAVTENKIRLAQSEQSHNQDWEMAALTGGDKWLRRISFAIWSTPMLWAAVDPSATREFWEHGLAGLPDWYVWGYLAISGAVWGISELKNKGVLWSPKSDASQ